MRLLTAISIASLVVSIAAVVFVLGLYAELEKSESDAPPMILSEHQVISLVKNNARCWYTKSVDHDSTEYSDLAHTESASFRPGGIWVVEAKSSWTVKSGRWSGPGHWKVSTTDVGPFECIYLVDDATGQVTSKVEN